MPENNVFFTDKRKTKPISVHIDNRNTGTGELLKNLRMQKQTALFNGVLFVNDNREQKYKAKFVIL